MNCCWIPIPGSRVLESECWIPIPGSCSISAALVEKETTLDQSISFRCCLSSKGKGRYLFVMSSVVACLIEVRDEI